jgi:hypothetical protein
MMDPVTLLLVVVAGQVLTRLTDAFIQRWTLCGRAEVIRAAAMLPPGAEVTEHDAGGAGWLASTQPVQGRQR